ncbi:hypothetical protein BKA69DRAFT_1066737 [Paraphysoderma sedebokerense]|nr:hypothetical protein BKA69DRAFT_1066737 [Paraphysoderma sedebokerense]
MKLYILSLKHVADIIENGVQRHPDITAEGIEVRSIANMRDLYESYLIEALNLKAAIEYQLKNAESAKECLHSMPARLEEELDPVTLHNHALINIEDDPSAGFEKFIYLLQQSSCPPETFGNLLLLYLKYEYYDAAADFLAENSAVARTVMNQVC